MTGKTDFINSMVNVFEQYGDEYTIEQAMEHVADYCQKNFVEQACDATEAVRKRAEYGYSMDSPYDKGLYQAAVEIQQAIMEKLK